jgi:hypothetical protein
VLAEPRQQPTPFYAGHKAHRVWVGDRRAMPDGGQQPGQGADDQGSGQAASRPVEAAPSARRLQDPALTLGFTADSASRVADERHRTSR